MYVRLIRFRYLVLVAIFCSGPYCVLRTFFASKGMLNTDDMADQTYRNRRHPVQPWTEEDWNEARDYQDFQARLDGDDHDIPLKHWPRQWQRAIGDQCWPLQKIPRGKWAEQKADEKQKVYSKTEEEQVLERGRFGRMCVFLAESASSGPDRRMNRLGSCAGSQSYFPV